MAMMAAERSGGVVRLIRGVVREMLVGYQLVRHSTDPQERAIGAAMARNARQDWFRIVGWPQCPVAPKASQRPVIDLPGVLSQAITIAEEEQASPPSVTPEQ